MNNLLNLISSANKSFEGVTFVNVKGYKSAKMQGSEQKDMLINVGVSFETEKQKDAEFLRNLVRNTDIVSELVAKDWSNINVSKKLQGVAVTRITILRAFAEMIKSAVAPDFVRSEAQKNAYIPLSANGQVAYCEETENVNIKGTLVRESNKVILDEELYKELKDKQNSKRYNKLSVAVKDVISSKFYNELRMNKKRTLSVKFSEFININGDSINFQMETESK